MSTLEDAQGIGGTSQVRWRMLRALEGHHEFDGGR